MLDEHVEISKYIIAEKFPGKWISCQDHDRDKQECLFTIVKQNKKSESQPNLQAANDPRSSPARLEQLAQDPDYAIRQAVAGNPSAPAGLLFQLAEDEIYSVRIEVARNGNTPVEILIKLSRDGWEEVRVPVAENKNTPVEVLVYLAKDPYSSVRRALQDNPNTPIEVRRNVWQGLRPSDAPDYYEPGDDDD